MRKSFFLFFVTLCSANIISSQSQKVTEQPNIIIFLVDDMGWQDTSVPFWSKKTPNNEKFHTPNMERLAAQGMKFTQGYAASVCSPSRVSLITGTNAARHRVTNWTLNCNTLTDVDDPVLMPPKWNVNGISTTPDIPFSYHAIPLPQILKNNGYHTILIGKAHFGAKGVPSENPLNLGFDVNVAGHAAGGLANYSGLKNFGNRTDGQPQTQFAVPDLEKYWGKDISVTEALTIEAISALEERPKEKPFFLYLSHYAVHVPIEPDSRFIQKYVDKGYNPTEAHYASMVEAVDKSLGDILDYLENNDLYKNTFVLFLSDNGGLSAVGRGGKAHQHNAPLNSGKGSAYEGGIRIPLIVQWKEKVKEATQTEIPIIIEDVFPTILEVAQIKSTNLPQIIDGQSFVSILNEEKTQRKRALFWHFPNNWHTVEGYGLGASSSIRLGNWKLIYMHKNQKIELFNLKKDIEETTNLAEKHPRKSKKLAKLLTEYLQNIKAQMPTIKNTKEKVPFPVEAL